MKIHWLQSALDPSKKMALRHWKNRYDSSRPPRGLVWILHGMGEHTGRYSALAEFLNRGGFDVAGLDHAGHGLTAKEGGFSSLGSFPQMLEEQEAQIQTLFTRGLEGQTPYMNCPWFLVGHSMGALLGLYWLVRGKSPQFQMDFAQRAFLSAPPLKLRLEIPVWKEQLSKGLSSLLPDLKIPNGIALEDLSYDVLNQYDYERDPLVHRFGSPRNYESMKRVAAEIMDSAQNIEIPLCLAVGEDDPIVNSDELLRFYGKTSTHKRFFKFEKRRHEILNDVNKEQVWAELVKWIG
jgi:alpha-beta hydrolase superfamily lysophospholipase